MAGLPARRAPASTTMPPNFAADIPTFAHYLRQRGLSHHPLRQDAFLRPRPAARLRGAADDRHLSGRLSAGRRTGTTRDERPSWYHNMSSVTQAGLACAPTSSISTTRSSSPRERALFDHARGTDERPFLPRRLLHPSARPLRRSRRSYWDLLSRRRDRPARARRPAGSRSIRIRSGCATSATWTPTTITEDQIRARAARLLRRDLLCRRQSRPADEGARAMRARARIRSSSSPAITARCWASAGLWYKMSFFEGASRVPLVIAQPRPLRAAPGRRERVARRPAADAGRARRAATRRPTRRADRRAEPPAPSRRQRRPRRGDRRISGGGRHRAAA